VEGIVFEEIFAHKDKMNKIGLVLDMAAWFKWVIHHIDVKSTF
jgi:hypothetical protein